VAIMSKLAGADPFLSKTMNIENLKIEDATFTCIDVETTGLSPRTARVCEVAAISFRGRERLGTMAELVNPGCPIPAECTRVHGITDDMVKNSPAFGAVAPRLLAMLENSVLIAHNAEFDMGFLRMELERIGLKLPEMHVLDTLAMARKSWKFKSNRLGNIATELNIPNENWHRALSDVEMTKKIFEHFTAAYIKSGVVAVKDILEKI